MTALGVSVPAAASILAACGDDDDEPAAGDDADGTETADGAEEAMTPVQGGTLREGYNRDIEIHDPIRTNWYDPAFFAIYEACKDAGVHGLGSGVVAGVAAGFLTNPMDLVKTRMQVARTDPSTFNYAGAFDCVGQILRREGPLAFLDGAVARCATVAPRLTICVLVKDAIAPGVKDLIG